MAVIFLKIKAKNAGVALATASIFNAEVWEKNNISLSSLSRQSTRVHEGGHNIPDEVIERRYKSGIKNLFNIYLHLVDELLIFDNTNLKTELIAEKRLNSDFVIIKPIQYNNLNLYHHG
jgi:predicted ABC-type ATPase